jgi:copper(I)-binding protein
MIADHARSPRSFVAGSAVAVAVLWTAALVSAGETVTVENAWVPWAPTVVKVHAGYMTVINRSDADQQLVGASSSDYERVELHESSVKDGVSEMRSVDQVTIPANGRVAFAPAGLHFMLIGPRRPQAVGDRVRIVLRLRGVAEVAVLAEVRGRGSASHSDHHHHGGSQ